MKEPVDHIVRPRLPWRSLSDPSITECGYDATQVKTLSREQYFARLKEFGQQRTALLTCMTCSDTARRWGTWNDDPRLAIEREVQWEGAHWSGISRAVIEREGRGQRMKAELLAIAALIDAHPEEFRTLLAGIDARDEWLKRKDRKERAQ